MIFILISRAGSGVYADSSDLFVYVLYINNDHLAIFASSRSQRKENGSYQWSLNFSLDLGAQGAVQIRVNLDLPDIQMQMTAEKMSTVDRIKETLPLLEERFRQLGLCPSTLGCRQGKVSLTPMTEPSSSDGRLSIHI